MENDFHWLIVNEIDVMLKIDGFWKEQVTNNNNKSKKKHIRCCINFLCT